jgi:hypothetical protein
MVLQMPMTIEIARAAGADAADRRMRRAGRSKWSIGDYLLACRVTNELARKAGLIP